jgi:CheY-like chemotaxis protein
MGAKKLYSNITDSLNFEFQPDQLGQKLIDFSMQARTGYWKIKLDSQAQLRYLTLVQGRVVFSSVEPLSWATFREKLQRHLFKLKNADLQASIDVIEQESPPEQLQQIRIILNKIEKQGLITAEEVLQTSQKSILLDLDDYLFDTSGKAEFIADPSLITQAQIPGFKLEDLLGRANQRRIQWQQIKAQIPSLKAIPQINQKTFENSQLTPQQKQKIKKLIKAGKSLENIAHNLARDPLEIAQFFARIVQGGLVSLKIAAKDQIKIGQKSIFVVDDSPVLLQQFQRLVTKWGYQVHTCENPLNAVANMLNIKPDLVFIDINMPGITGFELIKEIRRKSDLSSLPLVLLTAEKSVSNKWRAQWANCKFLAKPRTKEEVQEFQKELQQLLQETLSLG